MQALRSFSIGDTIQARPQALVGTRTRKKSSGQRAVVETCTPGENR